MTKADALNFLEGDPQLGGSRAPTLGGQRPRILQKVRSNSR